MRGVADEIISGVGAYYQHRRLGWLKVKVTKVRAPRHGAPVGLKSSQVK